MDTHHRIREPAYALWVEEGCVHGRAEDYWFRAERELYALQPQANENAAKPKKTRTRRGPTVKEAA